MIRQRSIISVLALSAAALVGLALDEGYTDRAVIPIPGDVPTIGFGSTDGVKMGDKITPPVALAKTLRDVQKFEGVIKQCVTAPLYQNEYDAYTRLAYNVGAAAFCSSSIPVKLAAGDYAAACKTILDFNGVCIKRNNAGKCIEKKIIKGLVTRRHEEYQQCIGG